MLKKLSKKPTSILKIAIFIILCLETLKSDKIYRLNKLKSFWQGRGVAIPYPNRILLTSSKLRNQVGILSSMEPFDLGEYFTIEMTFDHHITNKEGSRQQVVFGMSYQPLGELAQVRDWDRDLPMPPKFNGFLLYIDDFKAAYAGFVNSSQITKDEVQSALKTCKLPGKAPNQTRFMLRLKGESLSLYFEDLKDGSLIKCIQITNNNSPGEVYMTLGSSDDSGQSQIEVSVLDITTPTDYTIVSADEKSIGDGKLAYWAEDPKGTSFAREVANFRATTKYYYENAKVYSEELMGLADKSLKDLRRDLAEENENFLQRLKTAQKVIGRESDQLEALGWVLTQNKNQHKYNVDDVLMMILDLLEQLADSVDKTDRQTQEVYELIEKLNVGSVAQELTEKVEAMMGPLQKLIFKSKFLSKDKGMDFLTDEEQMKDLMSTVRDMSRSFHEKVKQFQKKEGKSAMRQSLSIMIVIGLGVVLGLGYLFWRIKKAVDDVKR